MSTKRFMAIDANALIHRAYHALPPLTTPKGEPAGALYGLCLTLLNVLKTFKPTHIAAAFDSPEKTFRHTEFAEYKGTRKKADDGLIEQIVRAPEVLKAFGISVLAVPGFEADDIIGTLSVTAQKQKIETIIVTGDQDALQLINDDVKVFMLKRGIKDTVTMGENEVVEKYGLHPNQIVDYKSLRGDASDNIPGVPGIGEKTATELLQKYGTVENIYKKIDELPEKYQKKLREGEKSALMSKRLAKIDTNVPLDKNLSEMLWENYSREKAVVILRELGFSSLLARIPDVPKPESTKSQGTLLSGLGETDMRAKRRTAGYELIDSEKSAKSVVALLQEAKELAVDVVPLCGVAFAIEPGKAWYVTEQFVSLFRGILENEKIAKIGHDLKYQVKALSKLDISLNALAFDTMLASYVLSPNSRAHGLEGLVFTLIGHEMIPLEAVIGKNGKSQKTIEQAPTDDVAEYACEKADYTLRLAQHLREQLSKRDNAEKVFGEIEMPLIKVLAHMELSGIKVDAKLLQDLSKKIGKRVNTLEKQIHELAGEPFNVGSPQQLREILFNKLKLSSVGIGRIQSGLSTAADELEKLQDMHPIIAKIQEHRELAKLKNTYLDTLPELLDKKTGRLHTSYNQTGTATGRLSSSDPNLQNIPIRTEIGAEIRKAFVAERGYLLVGADYSQVELRIAAHVAKDKVMQKVFRDGQDIHTETAAFVFGVPLSEVTKDQRRQAKTLNFGVLYGMGQQAFARGAGVSIGEAQKFISEYMRTYRGIAEYMQEAKALAGTHGYVETMYGRRSYLPEINSGNSMLRSAAERAAINHPIQGAEGDIIKRAMTAVYEKISEGLGVFKGVKMLLQVHDELVFEVPEKNAKKFALEVKPFLENLEKLDVPLIVDVRIGKTWGEME